MNSNWIIKKSPSPECSVLDESLKFPTRNIYCVGRNYRDHAKEMGSDPDREQPFFFQKTSDILVNDNSEIEYPKDTRNFQYEVELVVAISEDAFQIDDVEAKDKVFGYALGVDFTKRDLQQISKDSGKPWFSGKVFYGSAVLSDIVPKKKSIKPNKMRIFLSVNGQEKQISSCDKMIWNILELISILSQTIPLKAGDLIFTGTPAGVGQLQKGDLVSAGLDQPNAISLSLNIV